MYYVDSNPGKQGLAKVCKLLTVFPLPSYNMMFKFHIV